MINKQFWRGKKIFLTGHTGFKGSWLSLWLTMLGARVYGYALQPPTNPNLYSMANIGNIVESYIADIRDLDNLLKAIGNVKPEIIIHMAAQPLVRESYKIPVDTYAINVMGTVNVLEILRQNDEVRVVLNITTDKCYENKEWIWGYRENEPLGGYDPYSSSKACAEMVTAAYRSAYFNPAIYNKHGISIATARAGNVIGGGDWAADRLIPDCIRALNTGKAITIRNPHAIRPWQHVLEPLAGYLMLCEKQYHEGAKYAEAWNFGPDEHDAKTVEYIVNRLCQLWGGIAKYAIDDNVEHYHEAQYLKLDCTKAKNMLGWQPKWNLDTALEKIINWVNLAQENRVDIRTICLEQISEYMSNSDR